MVEQRVLKGILTETVVLIRNSNEKIWKYVSSLLFDNMAKKENYFGGGDIQKKLDQAIGEEIIEITKQIKTLEYSMKELTEQKEILEEIVELTQRKKMLEEALRMFKEIDTFFKNITPDQSRTIIDIYEQVTRQLITYMQEKY